MLDLSPLYRILGAGCAPLQGAADPQCHPWHAVVGAECHPPRGAGCAPGTAPQCWLCSRQGGGCGYHPPGTASAGGVLGGPLGGVCGCCGTLPVSQGGPGPPQHQPWASLGILGCLQLLYVGGKGVYLGKLKISQFRVLHHPLARGFHLHQPWGSPGAHRGCSSRFLDAAGWALGLGGAGELSPPW